jgi:putative ABC transport system ATP-binding protein
LDISVRNVSKSYRRPDGEVAALSEVSLDLRDGEFAVVHGPSGSGKSTLLLMIGGLLAPDGGTVGLDGQDLYRLGPDQRAGLRARNIGFVFQQFHLVPYLSVRENILAPVLAADVPDASARAGELIDRFGLSDRSGHLPEELSVGERQRTALARAMLPRPRLILADEPTGNLDDANGRIVLDCLAGFASAGGTVIVATHDKTLAGCAHRSVALDKGRAILET